MTAVALDGRALAVKIVASLKPRLAALPRAPRLLVVAASADAEAQSYRRQQLKACREAGIETSLAEKLPSPSGFKEYDAVIIDRPLPAGVDAQKLFDSLPPEQDAEGATAYNLGRLYALKRYDDFRAQGLVGPCTALAIAELARETRVPLAGKAAAVIGRSNIVGKPAAHLLSCLDLTVTLCHSKTRDLATIVAGSDVVVAATGRPGMIEAGWIKPGAIVIDAGITMRGKNVVGDVDPAAAQKASHYTPVPGGVGPVTTAMLLANTVTLAERALEKR
jgi:methylenetetrahydrofolate dehydrogenase (NADP+) / methenyltetrahydrofolate cyclohydrolase